MDYTLRATTTVASTPDEVFDVLTDLEHLPDWNLEIPSVVETPPALVVGSQWVVRIRAMHTHWNSRSTVVELDRPSGRFAYRSQTDDGNPSHADWSWQLTPTRDGNATDVVVEVAVRPVTFWRRRLLSEVRKPSLRKAMDESLTALREQALTRKEQA